MLHTRTDRHATHTHTWTDALEQNESDTGNMQLPLNSPGSSLVHVLFSQFVFFPINGTGLTSGKPQYALKT